MNDLPKDPKIAGLPKPSELSVMGELPTWQSAVPIEGQESVLRYTLGTLVLVDILGYRRRAT